MATKTYNYTTAYPINTEAGGADTHLSSFQKIKMEFERVYRLLNSTFQEWQDTMDSWQTTLDDFKTEINQKISDLEDAWSTFKSDFETAWESYKTELSQKLTDLETKLTKAIQKANATADYTNGTAYTLSKSDGTYSFTAPIDGYVTIHGYSGTEPYAVYNGTTVTASSGKTENIGLSANCVATPNNTPLTFSYTYSTNNGQGELNGYWWSCNGWVSKDDSISFVGNSSTMICGDTSGPTTTHYSTWYMYPYADI